MNKQLHAMIAEENKSAVQAEIIISWALRIGVYSCGAIIALGLLSRLFNFGAPETESSSELITQLLSGNLISDFHPVASPAQLVQGGLHWQPDLIITTGILLLIALPVVRVALTVLIFLREKDWPFVGITLLVLTVLLSGIFLGRVL